MYVNDGSSAVLAGRFILLVPSYDGHMQACQLPSASPFLTSQLQISSNTQKQRTDLKRGIKAKRLVFDQRVKGLDDKRQKETLDGRRTELVLASLSWRVRCRGGR
jgi:hypothetical protein